MAKDTYEAVFPQVGKQYTTEGSGIPLGDRYSSSRRTMTREGVPGRVVIDITNVEGESRSLNQSRRVRPLFWKNREPSGRRQEESEDLMANQAILDGAHSEDEYLENPEIPVHPYVVVYHLTFHQRFRLNVMELAEYEYDKSLGSQLVLPQVTKNIVDVLVSQGRISFPGHHLWQGFGGLYPTERSPPESARL